MVVKNIIAFMSVCVLIYYTSLIIRSSFTRLFVGLKAISAYLSICILGLQLAIMGMLKIPWQPLWVILPWLAMGWWQRAGVRKMALGDWHGVWTIKEKYRDLNILEWILIASILTFAGAFFIKVFVSPIAAWDTIALWGLKAKAFYFLNQADPSIIKIAGANNDYPPLYPLIMDLLFIMRGEVNNYLIASANYIFYLLSILALSEFFRNKLQREMRLVVCTLFAGCINFFPILFFYNQMGYADFFFGISMMLALIVLHRAIVKSDSSLYLLSIVVASFSALIKNEGQLFLLTIASLAVVINFNKIIYSFRLKQWQKIRRVILLTIILFLPVVLWKLFTVSHGFRTVLITPGTKAIIQYSLMHKARRIIHWYFWFGSKQIGYFISTIALALTGVCALVYRRRSVTLPALFIALGLQLVVAMFIYLFITPLEIDGLMASTLDRLLIQLTPATILLIGICIFTMKLRNATISKPE